MVIPEFHMQCECETPRLTPFGAFKPTVYVCGKCGGNATAYAEAVADCLGFANTEEMERSECDGIDA